jgi:hypothetical protein
MKLLFALALVGCFTTVPKPNTSIETRVSDVPRAAPVSTPGDDLKAVCANLKGFGCPEGNVPDCPHDLATIRAERIVLPTTCLISANTLDALRACGDSGTLRVRCMKP